jgi:hypothetical protein
VNGKVGQNSIMVDKKGGVPRNEKLFSKSRIEKEGCINDKPSINTLIKSTVYPLEANLHL